MRKIFFTLALIFLALPAHAAEKETAYDRVMRTNTIRCGYVPYIPYLIKDPNTGAITGISAEIMEKIAAGLALKIEWTEETGTASFAEGLRTGRFDMLCNVSWGTMGRARVLTMSYPVYFVAVNAVTKAGNEKFDNKPDAVNNPATKISSVDGSAFTPIAQTLFPAATIVSHPELTDLYQPLTDVATGKADVAFAEDYVLNVFMKNNPGTVRKIASDRPARMIRTVFHFRGGEYQMAEMINNALALLQDNGEIDKILRKYESNSAVYRRVAAPYQEAP